MTLHAASPFCFSFYGIKKKRFWYSQGTDSKAWIHEVCILRALLCNRNPMGRKSLNAVQELALICGQEHLYYLLIFPTSFCYPSNSGCRCFLSCFVRSWNVYACAACHLSLPVPHILLWKLLFKFRQIWQVKFVEVLWKSVAGQYFGAPV